MGRGLLIHRYVLRREKNIRFEVLEDFIFIFPLRAMGISSTIYRSFNVLEPANLRSNARNHAQITVMDLRPRALVDF